MIWRKGFVVVASCLGFLKMGMQKKCNQFNPCIFHYRDPCIFSGQFFHLAKFFCPASAPSHRPSLRWPRVNAPGSAGGGKHRCLDWFCSFSLCVDFISRALVFWRVGKNHMIPWESKTKQRMVLRVIHEKLPYYQWAKIGLWTSWGYNGTSYLPAPLFGTMIFRPRLIRQVPKKKYKSRELQIWRKSRSPTFPVRQFPSTWNP